MDERLSFVAACLGGEVPMTALCAAFQISRKTGYEWLGRYREPGAGGLGDRSRAPLRPGRAVAAAVREAVLTLRRERPQRGSKKLRAVLLARRPEASWPACSTIGHRLRCAGLVAPGRRRRAALRAEVGPLPEATVPNARWCIDFKSLPRTRSGEWFRTADGARCDPLTVTDALGRTILELRIVAPRTGAVDRAVARLFRAHGLPGRMLMDKGSPFASSGAGGLSRRSVKWVKLGIRLERITPRQPQENRRRSLPSGRREPDRGERMHRTLKAETSRPGSPRDHGSRGVARPPAATVAEQQARFDAFLADFNRHRPHEALGQVPPASLWRPSPRPYPARIEAPWYPPVRLRPCTWHPDGAREADRASRLALPPPIPLTLK